MLDLCAVVEELGQGVFVDVSCKAHFKELENVWAPQNGRAHRLENQIP